MFQRAIIAIAALVLVLAVLQYRWIDRVSLAEKERLETDLHAGARRFSQEFNGEVARAFITVQAGRPEPNGRDLEEAAARIGGWMISSPAHRIVRGFYRTRGGIAGIDEFLEYNPATGTFEPAAWPARLAEMRGRLEMRSRERFTRGAALAVRVEEDVPALIGMRPAELPEGETVALGGWSIVELDLEYIRQAWLPELARKHFGDTYAAWVVSRSDAGRVIYGTAAPEPPDVSEPLLDVRLDVGPPRLGLRGLQRPPFAARGLGRVPMGLRPDDIPPATDPPPPVLDNGSGDRGAWKLLVNHRAGSLDRAVSLTRRRDLAVSFVLLVLLGASVALVVVSTRRAQRLAHQQMEFVAGVSHELRTPLTVISSAADNLSDGVVAGDAQIRRYGSVIRQESRRLGDMVEQLLRFAGLQSGRARYKLQAVEVEPVIERALESCQPELSESGIDVQTDIQHGVPPMMADAAALVHCVANLAANAVKHGREGGWIGISARLADYGEPAVEILVEDHGPGIDPADLPHIFEPFYRGRRAVSDQIKGAGLGLSLVKRIIEGQGGTVQVASKPGEGACFTLRLPIAPQGEP